MTYVITGEYLDDIFIKGIKLIQAEGILDSSRNGRVLKFPHPILTVYKNPRGRVLFNKDRRANPFFHLFESLWMLEGRQDLKFLIYFNKKMAEYSDDGEMIRGSAYGYRWRNYFNKDQLQTAIEMLKKSPDTRRVVISHWDPEEDLGGDSKDLPCNTQIYVSIQNRKLDLTVVNRSNDMIYGAYGSNAVHFSILQEYLAAHLGIDVGTYYQFSNNMHVYVDFDIWKKVQYSSRELCYYDTVRPQSMFKDNSASEFDADLRAFFRFYQNYGFSTIQVKLFTTDFFVDTVRPMWNMWVHHKNGNSDVRMPEFNDWAKASNQFMEGFKK
jgi:thymidylate synthase